MTDEVVFDGGGWDLGDDLGVSVLLGLAILFLPITLALLLLSAEVALLVALLPLVMAGQLLGLLPWVLVVKRRDGANEYVEVRGIRPMLAARLHYRSLRVR